MNVVGGRLNGVGGLAGFTLAEVSVIQPSGTSYSIPTHCLSSPARGRAFSMALP